MEEPCTLAANDHHDNGLGHHGDPDDEEVIVLEEPERPDEGGPRVVRVPRAPTQREIDAHEATHIPHAEWCEFCMAGRARNKLHRKKSKKTRFCIGEVDEEELEATGTPGRPVAESASSAEPVSRVCMDYFYVSSRSGRGKGASRVEAQTMSPRSCRRDSGAWGSPTRDKGASSSSAMRDTRARRSRRRRRNAQKQRRHQKRRS